MARAPRSQKRVSTATTKIARYSAVSQFKRSTLDTGLSSQAVRFSLIVSLTHGLVQRCVDSLLLLPQSDRLRRQRLFRAAGSIQQPLQPGLQIQAKRIPGLARSEARAQVSRIRHARPLAGSR